ncbi:MAG TPA: polyphosphate kinase 2 family protein [Bacteroidota bacterium]|nr:polyphosphate kinase 2 family protein [Bacteroidota bacterium]
MDLGDFLIEPGRKVNLARIPTDATGSYRKKEEAEEKLVKDIGRLAELQELLYASATHAVLLIVQAMDAAGKDGVIKHVMSGVNPQGCRVASFKEPSAEELRHDYLWRCVRELPPRGFIGIFNRSYYEEVLTVRLHPELLARQNLPPGCLGKKIWEQRFEDITNFERYLSRNGTAIVKVFLHVSKEEQKRRFLERLDDPEKTWKYSPHDLGEREYWDRYMELYGEAITATSSSWAPWHVVPADHKWFTRIAVADLLVRTLKEFALSSPPVPPEVKKSLKEARRRLKGGG